MTFEEAMQQRRYIRINSVSEFTEFIHKYKNEYMWTNGKPLSYALEGRSIYAETINRYGCLYIRDGGDPYTKTLAAYRLCGNETAIDYSEFRKIIISDTAWDKLFEGE